MVVLKSGQRLPGDVVVLGLGVKPDVGSAFATWSVAQKDAAK